MSKELLFNGERLSFRAESAAGKTTIEFHGERGEFEIQELEPGRLLIQNGNGQVRARVARDRDRVLVWAAGRTYEFKAPAADDDGAGQHGGKSREVRAPMPGTLIKLFVRAGESVDEGQILAVVEAMKMEHPLRAPRAGVVEATTGTQGSIVDGDAVIVLLAEEE